MRSREVGPVTINRTARIGIAVITGLALNFGIDQGSKIADADTATPTNTATLTPPPPRTPTVVPTATPTPDVLATQIAQAQKNIEELRRRQEMERKLANLNATEEALKNPPTETPKPIPSNTPPASATPGPKINEVVVAIETVVAGRMNEKATATARAESKFTPTPKPSSTPSGLARGNGERGDEGGFPWIPVAGLAALAGGGVAYLRSAHVRNGVNYAASWVARGAFYYGMLAVNFVRNRLGGGGAGAAGGGAPAGGAPGGVGGP